MRVQRCGVHMVALLCLSDAARADISENFESYAAGAFPSARWTDVGTLVPGSTAPNPSGTVVNTTGPAGATRAFQTSQAVSTSQGIVTNISPSAIVSISADVRYDRFDNSTNRNGGGWPLALGFFQSSAGNDPNFSPQVTLYADSTFKNWSLYIQKSADPMDFQFIRLTGALTATNTWYHMSLQVDTVNGIVTSQVRLASSSSFLVNNTRTIAGWNTSFAQYNIAGAIDGEYFTNATIGGQATVDNLTLVPGPGAIALGVLWLAATVRRERRARSV